MKIQKPKLTPIQLNEKYKRWSDLIQETDSHELDCQCNLCMECFGLGELLEMFSEDEHATAVIRENQMREIMQKNENNIFDRLRMGVSLETLSARDAEIINELEQTGNELITLLSDTLEIQEQIDAAVPFYFVVAVDDGTPVINIHPDGAPDGKAPPFASGFALTSDVNFKWI